MKQEVMVLNDKEVKFEIREEQGLVEVFTDSRTIANVFDKQHKDLLKKIDNDVQLSYFKDERKISLVTYIDSKGESRPMYLLDRDAFSYFVMSFTGKKASQWKIEYIKAFNEMEKKLKEYQKSYLLEDPIERAKAWIKEQEEKRRIEQEKKQLEVKLDESLEYASIKKVFLNTGINHKWRDLKKKSEELSKEIKKVFDQNYGSVNTYRKDVWLSFSIDISKFSE